jgi:prepilin-type N-terminal cleavage/methylation domain-containing protein
MFGSNQRESRETGFSLLELLVSLSVFVVISGITIGSLGSYQQNYRSSEIRVALEQKMRAALELMAQEISQAGLQPSGVDTDGLGAPLATVAAASCTGTQKTCITGSPSAQWVNVTTVGGIYVGEYLRIDAGPGPDCYTSSNCEDVAVLAVSAGPPAQIRAIFQYTHNAQTIGSTVYPTPIYGMGAYPQGIVPPGLTSPPPSGGSSSSQLEIFGDLNGVGNSLQAVIYACPATFPGPFKRTLYDATTGSQISSINLIDNVTACQFTYPATPFPTVSVAGTTESVVTSVGVSVTAQSTMNDPQTAQPITVTKSFLNIQPRNIVAAFNEASGTVANELQPNPGTLP